MINDVCSLLYRQGYAGYREVQDQGHKSETDQIYRNQGNKYKLRRIILSKHLKHLIKK